MTTLTLQERAYQLLDLWRSHKDKTGHAMIDALHQRLGVTGWDANELYNSWYTTTVVLKTRKPSLEAEPTPPPADSAAQKQTARHEAEARALDRDENNAARQEVSL